MKPRIDMTGMKVGKLTINYPVGTKQQNKSRAFYWNATCACGNTVDVIGNNVRRGLTTSCGCDKLLLGDEASFRAVYRDYKRGAIKRGYTFELTEQQTRVLMTQPCSYCGSSPSTVAQIASRRGERNERSFVYNGIDRVDNNKGYTTDNTVTCCKTCNYMKGTLTRQEFLDHIHKIAQKGDK